jgi:hypothetical protein
MRREPKRWRELREWLKDLRDDGVISSFDRNVNPSGSTSWAIWDSAGVGELYRTGEAEAFVRGAVSALNLRDAKAGAR